MWCYVLNEFDTILKPFYRPRNWNSEMLNDMRSKRFFSKTYLVTFMNLSESNLFSNIFLFSILLKWVKLLVKFLRKMLRASHQWLFRAYSWLCDSDYTWQCLWDCVWYQGSNPGQLHARKALYPLHYLTS